MKNFRLPEEKGCSVDSPSLPLFSPTIHFDLDKYCEADIQEFLKTSCHMLGFSEKQSLSILKTVIIENLKKHTQSISIPADKTQQLTPKLSEQIQPNHFLFSQNPKNNSEILKNNSFSL